MAHTYPLYRGLASPVTGRYLAHNRTSLVDRAFMAADLHTGHCILTTPTVGQAAVLARVNRAYVHAALARANEREAIIDGALPLMPARRPVPLPVPMVDDAEIIDFVRRIGVGRVLDAAVTVEAAQ